MEKTRYSSLDCPVVPVILVFNVSIGYVFRSKLANLLSREKDFEKNKDRMKEDDRRRGDVASDESMNWTPLTSPDNEDDER
jgi:hypothetical protein